MTNLQLRLLVVRGLASIGLNLITSKSTEVFYNLSFISKIRDCENSEAEKQCSHKLRIASQSRIVARNLPLREKSVPTPIRDKVGGSHVSPSPDGQNANR